MILTMILCAVYCAFAALCFFKRILRYRENRKSYRFYAVVVKAFSHYARKYSQLHSMLCCVV